MAESSLFFIKVFQFILYVCGYVHKQGKIHCKMYDSFVTRTPINESHTLMHTHAHSRARTKLAGGWLGWIHDEVQAINFIWVSQTLQYHFLKHLYAHRLTWRQTDAHSRRHTLTFTFRIPWWNISHLFLLLAYQPNLSVPTSILLIYSEWFEVAVIRCGFSYVRIVYI